MFQYHPQQHARIDNFEGRQGKGSRTHLMSPAMAAAAAVTGRITDVRTLLNA